MNAAPDWLARCAAYEAGAESSEDRYWIGLAHGAATLALYRPQGTDTQGPHRRDEIYIVRRGTARLSRSDEWFDLVAGDTAFVPAGMPHRFEQFSDDFDAWVFFWGPAGGEPV